MSASQRDPNIIGLVCERAIEGEQTVFDGNRMKDLPNVKVVKFVCSGMIRPKMLENALSKGADGVFVTGCAFGDCTYRTGNLLIRDRLQGKRNPRLRSKRVETDRIDMFYLAISDEARFIEEVRAFDRKLRAIGGEEAVGDDEPSGGQATLDPVSEAAAALASDGPVGAPAERPTPPARTTTEKAKAASEKSDKEE
jgi:F420-non-reducing hydrogenase iron-sulfur subunit